MSLSLSLSLSLSPLAPGGAAADRGEAGAEGGGGAEAGGDPRVLAGPGEHHPGQGPAALRGQPGRPAGPELLQPGPSAGSAGEPALLRGLRPGPHHRQQTPQEAPGTPQKPGMNTQSMSNNVQHTPKMAS